MLRIPATNIRFGLDPVLALFPGVRDLLVSGAGAFFTAFYLSNSRNLAILTT